MRTAWSCACISIDAAVRMVAGGVALEAVSKRLARVDGRGEV